MSLPGAVAASLDALEFANVLDAFRDALRTNEHDLNRLNVYPVPDGDTGTNMALTLESVVAATNALGPAKSDMALLCKTLSHASLMGARGNSGVILSQILRGIATVVAETKSIDGPTLARALRAASVGADGAVVRPVEGTILTVARDTAAAAETAATDQATLLDVVAAARTAAHESLARTPDLLPALRLAGVVDAGGAGYGLLLDAFRWVLDATPLSRVAAPLLSAAPSLSSGASLSTTGQVGGLAAAGPGAVDELRYEVMYFLEAPDATIPAFKDAWAALGDSIVVVGGDGLWNCHIHTDDIGATIEAAIDIGRPRSIRVTDLHDQVHALEEERWVREAAESGLVIDEPPHVHERCETAIVTVCAGDGVRRLFWSLGAQRVVTGGQTMNPSTAQLLDAVVACPAQNVVILPNNKNIIAVAEQVVALAAEAGRHVRVVKSRAVTEGLAAAMQYDPMGGLEENASAMDTAVAGLVACEITRAVRDTSTGIGAVLAGDWLGLARDEGIVACGPDLVKVATALLTATIGEGHGIVTILEGEGASPALTRTITEWLHDEQPAMTVEVHHGGQPLYPYLFGIE